MQYCLKLPLVSKQLQKRDEEKKRLKEKTFYRISTAYPENIRQPLSPQI